MFDFSFGVESDDLGLDVVTQNIEVKKECVETILSFFNSGISFDIAKNHIGVCKWLNGKVEVIGFAIDYNYDKGDYLAESKMRLWLKDRCKEIMGDDYYEVCQVEGVFGGENFDTTRKLISLNGVVAELILENKVNVGSYYNLTQKEWAKDFRKVIKLGKALSSKYETQEILKYLDFEFAIKNADLSEAEKKRIYYEDICDAVGMLCGLALRLNCDTDTKKSSSIRLSDIKMYFMEDTLELHVLKRKDDVLDTFGILSLELTSKDLEKEIKTAVEMNPDNIIHFCVDNAMLGRFGIQHNIPYYDQGYVNIICYNKNLKRRC